MPQGGESVPSTPGDLERIGNRLIDIFMTPIPLPQFKQKTPEENDQFWESLHHLLMTHNPLNLDLPGNPRDPYIGEKNYPYPEVFQKRYGKPYIPGAVGNFEDWQR